ncbi:MAG: hypothetical protein AAFO99_11890 [Bacteroidota bacterium]
MLEKLKSKIESQFPVSQEFWKELQNNSKQITVKKNNILVAYGSLSGKSYFVAKGSFKSSMLTISGNYKTVWFYFDELFYFIPILDSRVSRKPTKYEIMAMEDSVVIEMENAVCRLWYEKYHEFNMFSRMDLIKDFTMADDIRTHLISYSKEDFLRYLYEKYPIILSRTPSKTVADFMGITPEWYSKIKKKINLKS